MFGSLFRMVSRLLKTKPSIDVLGQCGNTLVHITERKLRELGINFTREYCPEDGSWMLSIQRKDVTIMQWYRIMVLAENTANIFDLVDEDCFSYVLDAYSIILLMSHCDMLEQALDECVERREINPIKASAEMTLGWIATDSAVSGHIAQSFLKLAA